MLKYTAISRIQSRLSFKVREDALKFKGFGFICCLAVSSGTNASSACVQRTLFSNASLHIDYLAKDRLFQKDKLVKKGKDQRTLFSDASLRIDYWAKDRIFQKDKLGKKGKEGLVAKLQHISCKNEAKLASNDIMYLIKVADKEDHSLLHQLMKYLSCPEVIDSRVGNFGTHLLRLYHHLDLQNEAYSIYSDKDCSLLLSDATCCLLMMDLLYKNGEFPLVVDLYRELGIYHIDCLTLALGALYHINPPYGLEIAYSFLNEEMSRRAVCFLALFCLNQNEAATGIEILNKHSNSSNSFLINNIKIMCLSGTGNVEVIFSELEKAATSSKINGKPHYSRFYSDTIQLVEETVSCLGSSEQQKKLRILRQKLKEQGILSGQTTAALVNRIIPGINYFRSSKPIIVT